MSSIKDKQTESIERMLNFNRPNDAKETWDEPWKVLIYDSYCQDIISPLLRVGDLRKHGITLHMLLHSDRQAIPDVPCIYFVLPTKDNIKRICDDFKNHLYESYHLNFASNISRPLLEEIANAAVECDSVHQISKVYDQYMNFISLEKDLITFSQKGSYVAFNDHTLSDVQAEQNIESAVDGIFSVLATLGVVPIIRCPKNSAAEAIASQLDTKLHDHLINIGNLFSDTPANLSFQRPVLIILDRNIDLNVMLHHTWTYQALVHDLLNMTSNRIQVDVQELDENSSDKSTKTKQMKYDLDSNDSFWTQNVGTAFPNIAVAVNAHLKEYKSAMDEFNKIGGTNVNLDDESQFDESQNQILGKTKDLGTFVNTIPALREKKRMIDVHTNIATAILNQIKSRELDTYYSLEESILNKSPDKKEILNIISDPDPKRGTTSDKMRLFLIYLMNNNNMPASDFEQFEEALTKAGCNLAPIKYIKKIKAFNDMSSVSVSSSSSSGQSTSSIGGKLLNKVNFNMGVDFASSYQLGGSLTRQLGTLFTAGVKALLPSTKELLVTRIVDAIMEMKNEHELNVENYLYFDPKIQKKMRQTSIPRKNTPFKEAIVFIVGGGNYVEYLNLQEYAKKMPTKKIIYGSSEMLNATQFLNQLNEISSTKK